MFDIERIRKKMTREDFINEGSCPSNYGLINGFDVCNIISYNNCCKCREKAVKDIKFKDDELDTEQKIIKNTVEEVRNNLDKYAGWEIIKMLDEGKLRKKSRVIWHNGANIHQEEFILRDDGCLYSAKYHKEADISYFLHATGQGYFTIEEKEYMTFKEAQKLGTPKHKTLGYSYQDYKVREFIENMDRKVWYI